MTLKDLLHIQLHGEENLNEEAVKKQVASFIDEEFDLFLGTKRAEHILEGFEESLPYMSGLRKAINFLKVSENKMLKEEIISKNGAKILLHDAMNGIYESIHNLEKSVVVYNRSNKKELAKVYSTLMFEAQMFGDEYGVEVKDFKFKNEEMTELVTQDFKRIAAEVL